MNKRVRNLLRPEDRDRWASSDLLTTHDTCKFIGCYCGGMRYQNRKHIAHPALRMSDVPFDMRSGFAAHEGIAESWCVTFVLQTMQEQGEC